MAEQLVIGQEADKRKVVAKERSSQDRLSSWWSDVWRRFWQQKLAVAAGVRAVLLDLYARIAVGGDGITPSHRDGVTSTLIGPSRPDGSGFT